jgi:hypothetical protein
MKPIRRALRAALTYALWAPESEAHFSTVGRVR